MLEAGMTVLGAYLTTLYSQLQVSAWSVLSVQEKESMAFNTIVDRKVPFHYKLFLLMHPLSRIVTKWSFHMTQ